MRIKTYPEVVGSILASFGQRTNLTNFNTGSVIRTLTEVYAVVVTELYAFGAEMLKQGFLDTATGFWLDRKAKEYGLTRKPADRKSTRLNSSHATLSRMPSSA